MKQLKRWRLWTVAAGMVAALLAIAGCSLTQPQPVKEAFLLQFGNAPAPAPRPHPGTLRIGTFGVVAPFEGRGLVYRRSDYQYVSDFYNEYFVSPGAMIRERIGAYLTQARPFENIAIDAQVGARFQLRGVVTQLVGDVRDKAAPSAVLAIHFYLVATDAAADRPLLDRVIERRVPLRDASAGALVEGLSRALDGVLAALAQELMQLQPRASTSSP